jgi:hemerythrin-like metal-binding protein
MGNFFEWDQAKYSVEVPQMDREHQAIIASMNKLFSMSESGAASAQLGRVFAELVQLTVKHFADEEAYMESIHYAGLGSHKLIHKSLLASVMSHKEKFDRTGKFERDFFDFLRMWLKAHICGIDVKYGRDRLAA